MTFPTSFFTGRVGQGAGELEGQALSTAALPTLWMHLGLLPA